MVHSPMAVDLRQPLGAVNLVVVLSVGEGGGSLAGVRLRNREASGGTLVSSRFRHSPKLRRAFKLFLWSSFFLSFLSSLKRSDI